MPAVNSVDSPGPTGWTASPGGLGSGSQTHGIVLAGGVAILFPNGSRERGDVLIGADGIHSVIRGQLFGDERIRFAGYLAWRGIAQGAIPLPEREALVVLARGAQAGCFHCGEQKLYWFLTRNAAPGSLASPPGNRGEVIERIQNWRVPFRVYVETTAANAILRDDVIDRPARRVWGAGRVTLLGDAIHATTPNLGQGACQALEDAVVLADSLRRCSSPEAGLRVYEARRRRRANYLIRQSRRVGIALQLSNPAGVWLRKRIGSTHWAQKRTEQLFDHVLRVHLPELAD